MMRTMPTKERRPTNRTPASMMVLPAPRTHLTHCASTLTLGDSEPVAAFSVDGCGANRRCQVIPSKDQRGAVQRPVIARRDKHEIRGQGRQDHGRRGTPAARKGERCDNSDGEGNQRGKSEDSIAEHRE